MFLTPGSGSILALSLDPLGITTGTSLEIVVVRQLPLRSKRPATRSWTTGHTELSWDLKVSESRKDMYSKYQLH